MRRRCPVKGAPRIQIRGLRCQAHVGVPASEQKARQELVVGLDLEYDSRAAATGDDWPRAVDYQAIADAAVELVEGQRVKLIEALASRLAEQVLGDPRVLRVRVEVSKPNALARADTVRAVLEREQAPHTALIGLATSEPHAAETRTRVETLLRRRHEVIAESAGRLDEEAGRQGRALLLRTPLARTELVEELNAMASRFGGARGHAHVVELDLVAWNGRPLEPRARRWGFLSPGFDELLAEPERPSDDG